MMGDINRITQKETKKLQKVQAPVSESPDNLAKMMPDTGLLTNSPGVAGQAALLERLPDSQGHAVANRIERTQGNRHMQRVMTSLKNSNTAVQTKLTVSEPGDEYESEADQVADQVMKMSAPDAPPPTPPPGGNGDDNTGQENRPAALNRYVQRVSLQRSSDGVGGNEVDTGVESRIQNMQRGGKPLPETERNFFESRMGVDLGSVKIHNDSEAAATSEDLNAQAYTVGSNIAFGDGKYQPGTTAGRQLLAHELTHVVQQGGAGELSRKSNDAETEMSTASAQAPTTETTPAAQSEGKGASPAIEQAGAEGMGMQQPTFKAPASSYAPTEDVAKPPVTDQEAQTDGPTGASPSPDAEQKQDTTGAPAAQENALAEVGPPVEVQAEPTTNGDLDQAQKPEAIEQPEPQPLEVGKTQQAEKTERQAESQEENEENDKEEQEANARLGEDAANIAGGESGDIGEKAKEIGLKEPPAPVPAEQAQAEAQEMLGGSPDKEKAAAQQEEAEQMAEESSEAMAALDGAEAIMPEEVWEKLGVTDAIGGTPSEAFSAETKTMKQETEQDLLVQRTPDPSLQNSDPSLGAGGIPQFTPEAISIPEITVDTAPITTAQSEALTAAKVAFASKSLALNTAVTTAKMTIQGLVSEKLQTINTEFNTNLDNLDSAAETAKENIGKKYDTASQTLNTLEQGIPARAQTLVTTNGVDLVQAAVQDYASKCEPDAMAAIASYAAKQRATPDDGRSPLLGGPGEEDGYHAKKAAEAERAAKEVGAAYAEEYQKQGTDTVAVFNGEVLSGLTEAMQNEVTGMRQMLDTAYQDALVEVDTVKEQLVGQAKDIQTQSVEALQAAYTAVLGDLTTYQTEYDAALTTARDDFIGTLEASTSQAIAQVETALGQAQASLTAAVEAATGPDKVLKPGAQALIDQAAAEIQASLTDQVNQAAAQISGMGTTMAGTVDGIDVESEAVGYSDSFNETGDGIVDSLITGVTAVVDNMGTYDESMSTESGTLFDSYAEAANTSVKQIEDTAGPNLANFVNQEFIPGLEKTHGDMKAKAADEGEKAGDAVQPAWKGWLKAIVSVVIAIVVAVAIAAIVVGTGGVAGLLLGALAGAAIGAAGGVVKCLAFNAIDGKPAFENVGQYVIEGAISGAIQGATAGFLAAPTGAAASALTGSRAVASGIASSVGKKLAVDTLGGALKDMTVEAYNQWTTTGQVNWGAVAVKGLESAVINVATFGILKGVGAAGKAIFGSADDAAKAATTQTVDTAADAAGHSLDDGLTNGAKDALDDVPEEEIIRFGGLNFNKQGGLYLPSAVQEMPDIAPGVKLVVGPSGLSVPVSYLDEMANAAKQSADDVAGAATQSAAQDAVPGAWQQAWDNVPFRGNFGKNFVSGLTSGLSSWDTIYKNKLLSYPIKEGMKSGYYNNFYMTTGGNGVPSSGVDLTPWDTSKEMWADEKKQAEADNRRAGYQENINSLPTYSWQTNTPTAPNYDYQWQTQTPTAPNVDFETWNPSGQQSPYINQPDTPSFNIGNNVPTPDLDWDVVTVQSGDTLWDIAEEQYGDPTRWPEIYQANQGAVGNDPNMILPNQSLVIPEE